MLLSRGIHYFEIAPPLTPELQMTKHIPSDRCLLRPCDDSIRAVVPATTDTIDSAAPPQRTLEESVQVFE